MPDATAIAGNATEKAGNFFGKIVDIVNSTHIPQQINDVDFAGLFTNPWFMVPFVSLIGWQVYKQAFRDMIIIFLIIGVWYVSGTHYMQTLIVGGELQIGKILPILFGGAGVLGIIIYLLFGRS